MDARQLAAACLARLAELFPAAKVVIGIGGTCRDPREVARSYAQAQRTTQTLQRLGRSGAVAAFGDLGILRLLLQVPDLAELRSFAADVLGKLSMHEHEHKSEYLTTLACYFRENNSPQRASRILHVHPNTVAYRVKRIEEITGLRLDNYTDRLIAQVALEILDSLGERAVTAPSRAAATTGLGQRVLVCDGAMGTMLHAAGAALDRSLPELNLSDPGLVSTIHESYLSAGADIIQTNTFGANRLWLGDHGFPDKVRRDQPGRRPHRPRGPGAVRPRGAGRRVGLARRHRRCSGAASAAAERMEVIREQIRALAGTGVDVAHPGDVRLPRRAGRGRAAWPATPPTCRSSPRPPSPTTRTPWAGRPRARSPPCCPDCRWRCSAPTAPSARSGCSPWPRTWSGTRRCR